MRQLLIAILIALISAPAFAQDPPFERIEGMGWDRANLTDGQVESRSLGLQTSTDFWLLRHPQAENAPDRIVEGRIWEIIQRSALETGIDPLVGAGLIFIESMGRENAESTNRWQDPKGIVQLTAASAWDEGLTVVYKTVTTKTSYKVWSKKRKRYITRTGKVKKFVMVQDDRYDPELAIPAGFRRLARTQRWFGGKLDFAIAEYHMGSLRMMNLMLTHIRNKPRGLKQKVSKEDIAEVIAFFRKSDLTYPQLFFRCTPTHNLLVYAHLTSLDDVDFSPTYYFRVQRARTLLKEYLDDSASYHTRVAIYQRRFGKETLPNPMWAFWTEEQVSQMIIADLEKLKLAREGGRIVPLPSNLTSLGVRVRVDGSSRIGEADLVNQNLYIGASPATVGCLLYAANELRLRRDERIASLETNSLVRHLLYQKDLKKRGNQNADTLLPTHAMGMAFDLPRKYMSPRQRMFVEFILNDLRYAGMLVYIREGQQATYHVVPHPEYTTFFEKVYRDVKEDDQATASSSH